ncbi:MAG: phenylalanine--tRNA ligase subunit beta [Breznakibacter sp.]|nr:phenylalanine--tRNA ligase subunit beta [Breznakibacter sp.]
MNISYNWLKNYINIDLAPAKVSEILTSLGLEVGSMEEIQSIKGGLEGLVVGEVLTCAKHPGADKLSVTTVNVGSGDPLPVVCGAPNVAAGQKVVVATVGTVLYSGDESFTIKASKIRGEQSMGMICAADEIGLGTDHSGIMVLPSDTPVGMLAKDYFKVENDVVFEVDLTPNRIDSASHYGIARDLAAYLAVNDAPVTLKRASVDAFQVEDHSFDVAVSVENSDACPRYCGVTINGVTVGESPDWLKNALRIIGLSPINNVVDVTNYVLHEMGQPLHAFDGDEIKGGQVIVKNLPAGTKFITLDEKERELSADDLMICNGEAPMCIGGVFGGLHSGVSEKTTKIFLESAWFNPVAVRKTARRHQLNTDASFRFERGTDPNGVLYALKRASLLIKEVAGGTISSEITDIYPVKAEDFEIHVSYKNIKRLIGKEIPKNTIHKILHGLEIKVKADNDAAMTLQVPPYRVDVTREADVIEEILRIYGYNNVEMPLAVHSTLVYAQKPDDHKVKNVVAAQLTGCGFVEIMNNSLTKAANYDDLTTFPRQQVVELANPLSSDLNGMRQTLLFGGLESVQHNRNRRNADLKLFEFGNCYSLKPEGAKDQLKSYNEENRLALLMTGLKNDVNWNTPAQELSFFDMKTQVENIISRLGIDFSTLKEESIHNDVWSEGLCLMVDNKVLVNYGMVHPKRTKSYDIDKALFFAEFNWDLLVRKIAKQNILYREISKFPEVKRDLALLLDKQVTFAQVKQVALKTEKKLLKKVSLFDVYEGKNLPEGKKSYAVSFVLLDDTKTLTDKQIDKMMQSFMSAFERELGAQIRK